MGVSYSLAGKVALVTGAARGIGLETARQLTHRGASVAMLDRDGDPVSEAAAPLGERAFALSADVTDAAAMQRAVAEVVDRFGGLDVVVANAGVAPPPRPMTVVDSDAYERVIEIDLLGVWRTVRPALGQIVERRGHVVVVASVYAFLNGAIASPYAVSKAGVEQLGRALRAELAIHGASASVAYFGFIDTAMVRDALEDPIGRRVEDALPSFISRRLSPAVAGESIVDGIERRVPRIIRPRWWRVLSVLRGVINPLADAQMERDRRLLDAVRDGERLANEESG